MALPVATQSALEEAQSTGLVVRDFVSITALTPAGADISFGFWSDIEDVAQPILDVRTGVLSSKDFVGGGSLLAIASIPQTAGLTFQNTRTQLNRSHPQVQSLFFSNNARAAKCDIYRGVFDAQTHLIVDPPTIRLAGKIDTAKQTISKVGGQDYLDVAVVPTKRELTRINPAKKSHATQISLHAGDNWRVDEGKKSPVIWGEFEDTAEPPQPAGLFGWGNFWGFL